jgi:hypothetical protein
VLAPRPAASTGAASRPPSRNCLSHSMTVLRSTPTSAATASTRLPSALPRRILARLTSRRSPTCSSRAPPVPLFDLQTRCPGHLDFLHNHSVGDGTIGLVINRAFYLANKRFWPDLVCRFGCVWTRNA